MRPDRGVVGFPVPATASAFRPGPAVSLRPPFPANSRLRVHPPSSFPPPPEFERPATCPPYPGKPRGLPEAGERLPWGYVPHRDISKRRPLGARGSQASSYGPSSTFRTSSTVCSATCLAGLFHPAATSRVCPSGVCPSPRSRAGFPRPIHALLPLNEGACGVTRASDFALDFRALLPAVSAVPTKPVKAPFGPRPSWASPPPGAPSLHRGNAFASPPPATFTATSPSQLVLGVSPVQGSVCLGPGYRPARGFRPEPPSSFRKTGSRPLRLATHRATGHAGRRSTDRASLERT